MCRSGSSTRHRAVARPPSPGRTPCSPRRSPGRGGGEGAVAATVRIAPSCMASPTPDKTRHNNMSANPTLTTVRQVAAENSSVPVTMIRLRGNRCMAIAERDACQAHPEREHRRLQPGWRRPEPVLGADVGEQDGEDHPVHRVHRVGQQQQREHGPGRLAGQGSQIRIRDRLVVVVHGDHSGCCRMGQKWPVTGSAGAGNECVAALLCGRPIATRADGWVSSPSSLRTRPSAITVRTLSARPYRTSASSGSPVGSRLRSCADQDDVGAFPRFQRAGDVAETQGLGRLHGRHAQ